MTVAELLGRISSRELTEWRAYLQLEQKARDKARRKLEQEFKNRR